MMLTVNWMYSQILTASTSAEFGTWLLSDQDGDGENWRIADLSTGTTVLAGQGECMVSNSWSSTLGVLTPDNIVYTPAMNFTGQSNVSITWSVGSPETTASTWYEEFYAVYVTTDLANIGAPIFSEILPGGGQMYSRTESLAAFDGQATVYVLFRHVNCTDENFIVLDDVIVSSSSAPCIMTASATATAETSAGANDGTATVSQSNGNSPFTYSWSPSGGNNAAANGLSPGTYTVTVTDSDGCTATANATVTAAGVICTMTANATATAETSAGANNGTATITPSNGNAPYTYSWSPSGGNSATANGLSPGTYTGTIVDSDGCTASASTTVNAGATSSACGMTVNITSTDDTPTFSGGTATATPVGGTPPYSYFWGPSVSAQTQTVGSLYGNQTYTVSVIDANGCVVYGTVLINEYDCTAGITTQITTTPSDPNTCTGTASIVVTGGTAPYNYSWNNGSTTSTPSITGECRGLHDVKIWDANNCYLQVGYALGDSDCTDPVTVIGSVTATSPGNTPNDGTATMVGTSGSGTHTYVWDHTNSNSGSLTNLNPGTYFGTAYTQGGLCWAPAVTLVVDYPPCLLTAEIETTNPSVAGASDGTATIVPINGTAPYSYSIGNSQTATDTGLPQTLIYGYVSDANGCETSAVGVVLDPPCAMSASATGTDESSVNGNNGTATAAGSGGLAPYSYSWSPSGGNNATATNLAPGTYTVTVSDAECSATTTVTISEYVCNFSVNGSSTDENSVGANDGTATVNTVGGTAPYSYAWSPSGGTGSSASNLSPGTYTVLVTDNNGCTASVFLLVREYLCTLTAGVNSTDETSNGANNGSISVSPTNGTAPYSYSWSPTGGTSSSANNLAAGVYIITVTDGNNCSIDVAGVINGPGCNMTVGVTGVDVSAFGANDGSASAVASGGASPYTYTWSPSGGTSSNASNLAPDTYYVIVTDANGCSESGNVTINEVPQSASIDDVKTIEAKLYPNPTNGALNVSLSEGIDNISIFSMNGKLVFNQTVHSDKITIDVSNLKAGTYIHQIETELGTIIRNRLVKQ